MVPSQDPPPPAHTEHDGGWSSAPCFLCGRPDGEAVLTIPHPDAPSGLSFVRQCAGCGLRRLDPRPDPDALGRYYAEAAGYNAFHGRTRSPRHQRIWDALRDGFSRPSNASLRSRLTRWLTAPLARWLFDINVRLDGRKGLRVLEVGSGYGDLLIYLQSRGCHVLGTDLSSTAAAEARRLGIEVRVGHLAELALPAASFDVAILSHSLEHVPNPAAELAELARILVPGGELHIAVPNGAAVRLETDGVEWIQLSHPYHFWFFDPQTLLEATRRAGFTPAAPPQTTTRHHAWGLWLAELKTTGFGHATRRIIRFLRGSIGRPEGGDVLRLVCRKQR